MGPVIKIAGQEIPQKDNSPWVPDFVETPYKDLTGSVAELNDKLDTVGYWINPVNWFTEAWAGLDHLFSSGTLDVPLIAATIIGIILIGLGANWPKKWLFWGWVCFWILRGLIFV